MPLADPGSKMRRISRRDAYARRAGQTLGIHRGDLVADGIHLTRGLPSRPESRKYILHALAVELPALEFEEMQR